METLYKLLKEIGVKDASPTCDKLRFEGVEFPIPCTIDVLVNTGVVSLNLDKFAERVILTFDELTFATKDGGTYVVKVAHKEIREHSEGDCTPETTNRIREIVAKYNGWIFVDISRVKEIDREYGS